MANDSPAVILFDSYGNELALADGYQITIDSKGIPIIIVNGNNEAKIARADNDGYLLNSTRVIEPLPAGVNIIGKIGVDSLNTGGLALETTLQTLATEATLIDAYNKLDNLGSKDFATETTLQTLATEATLQILATEATLLDSYNKLDSLEAKDFATETTLQTLATENTLLDSYNKLDGLESKDFATETTLTDAYNKLDSLEAKDFATETTLQTLATEATLIDSYNKLNSLEAKDFATETTLFDAYDKLIDIYEKNTATETTLYDTYNVLLDIRDTDGVKKITDQLPSGTNEIGKVAQGTKGIGSNAWPQVLYDSSGNAVGVVLDDALYRLQTDAKISKSNGGDLVHLDAIETTTGRGRLKATLYTIDGDPVSFASTPQSPASILNEFVMNGSNTSLLVDGSVTPVVYSYVADDAYDISLVEIKFTLVSNSVTFGSNYFGATSGPLPNGLLVEIISNSITGTIYNLKQNESFINFASPGGFEWVVSSKDMMSSTYLIGGGLKLYAGTGDMVRITVRDNISSASVYFKCFIKGNLLSQSGG